MSTVEIFPWNTNFETGIEAIDQQHRILVGLLNGLADHLVHQSENLRFTEVFDELHAYASFHFDAEERIWREHFEDDNWMRWHQKSHSDFIDGISSLISDYANNSYDEILERVIKFLTHWLAFHILESDRRMAKAVLLLPSGVSLEKAKEQANQEMSGSARILIDTILTMYDKLANSTVKMSREIYKRKIVEADLRQAQERADAAINAKSNLLATISHEIRTPLSAIATMVFMMRKGRVSIAHKEYLSNIELASKHVVAVLNNILDLSKMEAGKFDLEEEEIDISAILRNVTALISDRAKEKCVEILTPYAGNLPRLFGDSTRLQQALLNYADNAIKFTTAGRIAFFVHVVEENSKTILLRFEVEDTGAGIPKDSIPRLFNRFEQAEPSTTREHGGTGLGLEITKRIAEQMGGSVGVESAVGSGSSFWFSAKLKKKHKEQTASSGHPTVANNEVDLSVDTFRGCRVLVVEDDDVSRTVLQKMLRELGFKPDGASDGEEALRKAARHRYDLILMDIQMPKMNGVQTTERLRTMKNTLTTPIVALSGDVAVNTRDQCHDAGMNGFLLKPLDPNNFILVLKKAMVDRL